MKRLLWFGMLVAVLGLTLAGCRSNSSGASGAAACKETPAQDRWPGVYGRVRGEKEVWLAENGSPHAAGERRKVGWRVVGAVDRIDVTGTRLDGPGTFELSVAGRVAPNGQDEFPRYSDSAGDRHEKIVLRVR